uniref:Carbonic anhydrase n=1 Tax=Strombidinopsis acuminata TaxID=141414 RepID=A0A7S3SUA7_9SPIT|mmetsp:Transcript_43088/g.58480  ORF Transcript_43088/g.58480 Transcript_43088/m.58480 type:complete len:179 (+) Transcript_43088:329-865(+)
MHAPSEHTVDNKHHDLEMHFVHLVNDSDATDYSGVADFAVIGVFFDREAGGNEDNPFIASLAANSNTANGNTVSISNVQVADFLGGLDLSDGYYTYDGSFTTPPCTEGVKWVVVNQVQPISDAQLEQYTNRWANRSAYANGNGNNRLIMPLNDRTIYFSGAAALQMAAAATLIATQLF